MLLPKKRSQEEQEKKDQFLEELILLRQEVLELRTIAAKRLQAEAERNAAQARFASLLDTSVDAIVAVDEALRIILFNQGAEQVFDYKAEEALGQPLDLLLPARFAEDHRRHIQKFAAMPETSRQMAQRTEVFGRRRDGTEFPAEASISKLTQGGQTTFTVVLRDITERKQAEEALREREEQLQLAIAGSNAGLWRLTFNPDHSGYMAADEIYLSPRLKQYIGYEDDEFPNSIEAWQRRILPEDLIVVQKSAAEHLAGQTDLYEVEYRIQHKDGTLRWIYSRGKIQWDDQQTSLQWVGIDWDVTERKRLQERLEAIYQLGQELTLLHDEAAIAARVLETAAAALQIESASYGLVDTAAGELEYRYHLLHGVLQTATQRLSLTADPPQGIGVVAINERRAINLVDIRQERPYTSLANKWSGRQSELAAPMKIGDRVIGVLQGSSADPAHFSAEDQQLLQTLADQTAVALENVRLYEEVRRRIDELTTLNDQTEMLRQATTALTSTLDSGQVLDAILTQLEQVVPYDSACVFLWEEEGLHAVACRGFPGQERVLDQYYSSTDLARQEVEDNTHALMLTRMLQGLDEIAYVPGWLTVPLLVRGKLIGYLTLDSQRATPYTARETGLAQAFANQAAIAIQNARLFEEVRAGHKRLQFLSRRLVEVQETERRQVARELHDETGQALTGLIVGLRLLERELDQPEAVQARIAELERTADNISESIHRLAMDLRPASLDHLGLMASLRQYIETFKARYGHATQFETAGFTGKHLPIPLETNIYRIVQEALTNVIRHAQATQVDVILRHDEEQVMIIVEDNGVGFNPQTIDQKSRLGLSGIRERAEMLGGRLVVESTVGVGTTIFVEIPHTPPSGR